MSTKLRRASSPSPRSLRHRGRSRSPRARTRSWSTKMDGSLHFAPSPPPLGALFDEDFDLPDAAPEPEVIEPVFSMGELASARAAARREGHAAGLAEAAASDAAAARRVTEAIASHLANASDAAAALAEQTAEAIARLLL